MEQGRWKNFTVPHGFLACKSRVSSLDSGGDIDVQGGN